MIMLLQRGFFIRKEGEPQPLANGQSRGGAFYSK